MAKGKVGMLEALAAEVEAAGGAELAEQVMTGADRITEKTGAKDVALWVRGAMERLDALAAPELRRRVMNGCGRNCARLNHRAIDAMVARRLKAGSAEAYIAGEIRKPSRGIRLERDGDALIQSYTPQTFRKDAALRCYCSLVNNLPPEEVMSDTYCGCSVAFVRTAWEAVLERPVQVELLASAISGSTECRFRITPSSVAGPPEKDH